MVSKPLNFVRHNAYTINVFNADEGLALSHRLEPFDMLNSYSWNL